MFAATSEDPRSYSEGVSKCTMAQNTFPLLFATEHVFRMTAKSIESCADTRELIGGRFSKRGRVMFQ